MKILHIIDSMGLGGAQTVVKGIFEGQAGNNNIFLCALRKRDIDMKVLHDNIITNNSSNKFSFPILKVKNIILKNNIEVLHCHLAKSQIMGGLLKTFFFPDIKLIFHEHGEIFQEGKIYPSFMKLFRKKVDIYFAVSKATKKEILKKTNFLEEKVKVLYNFVDLNKFKKLEDFDIKKERKKYGLKKNDFVVGFASRLYEGKGWKEFVGSAKILIDKGYDLQFIIGGEGEDKEKIIRFIKDNKLENNITLIGYVENMIGFYNMLDCFIFPSHRESMGLTGLESNACGTPVISSNITGMNEVMINNKNSLLFKVKNNTDLSKYILKIFENEVLTNNLIDGGFVEVKKYNLEQYILNLKSYNDSL